MENKIFITKEDFHALTASHLLNRRDEPGQTLEWVELESISINKLTWLEDGEEVSTYYLSPTYIC